MDQVRIITLIYGQIRNDLPSKRK